MWIILSLPPAWRFSDEPTLSIGVEDGDPNYQFFRVLSAVRLADQTVVVANTGTGHLRFYDPDGRYVARAGGRGGVVVRAAVEDAHRVEPGPNIVGVAFGAAGRFRGRAGDPCGDPVLHRRLQ